MLSFKRFLSIFLIVVVLGGILLIYAVYENRPAAARFQSRLTQEREFMEAKQVEPGQKPRVWILGDSGDTDSGKIFDNVRQLCGDLDLTVAGEGQLDTGAAETGDLIIFCDASIGRYADPAELERLVAGGGRVILAAGFGEKEDSRLGRIFGVREISPGEDCHDMVFEKPLLPVQPEKTRFGGDSGSARIAVSDGAVVYIRDEETGTPIVYTYDWQEGRVCLINGAFLADIRCMGLLTGAIGALLPDFIYPVLGVKAVFLDNFPMITSADDELCRRVYGYSAEGFVRDVVCPAFQGISLRTDTPYSSGTLAAAASGEDFAPVDDPLFTAIGKSVLQFGGELIHIVRCPENQTAVLNEELLRRFSTFFPDYTVRGLALDAGNASPKIPDIPGADIRAVRGVLADRHTRFSWEDGRAVFPAATAGASMEDGELFSVCSVLGAYGMVSHVFSLGALIGRDENTAAWDLSRKQLGLFESEVLAHTSWLEGRTLTQTVDDVRSYLNLSCGWTKRGSHMELDCGGAAKGQAFFYHTDSRIVSAEGLTYQEVGNGYYLLRVQEGHGIITLEELK